MIAIRSAFLVLISFLSFVQPSRGDDTIPSLTAQIVEARTYTAQYVTLANQTFKPSSADYTESYKLYAAALSKYTAWNAYVTSALRAGKSKHLAQNSDYEKIASEASVSAKAFTDYVDQKTSGQSKAVIAVLSSLADLGVKVWSNISDKIKKDRDTAATAFANDTKWQTWNELIGKAQPADKAKPLSDQTKSEDKGKGTDSATEKSKGK